MVKNPEAIRNYEFQCKDHLKMEAWGKMKSEFMHRLQFNKMTKALTDASAFVAQCPHFWMTL